MPRLLSWRNLPIGRKAIVVIAVPVLPLIVTAVLYVQSTAAFDEARAEAERATANRLLLTGVFSLVVEAESSVRGYLLGGNPALLAQHQRTIADVRNQLSALEAGTNDPRQRDQLPALTALVTDRLAALDGVLATHPTTGLNSPEMMHHVERGALGMQALRTHVAVMEDIQAQVVAERAGRLRDIQERADIIVLGGTIAGVIGGLAAALMFTAGITRRLGTATDNMSRLARREPLLVAESGTDEIGRLTASAEQAAQLLAERDRLLEQRMQELESLTRELEAFSYSVSHDLRAPLRHVVGFATMLQKSADTTLTSQQHRYIRTIVEAASRMGRLIDDLLAFSRTGRAELRKTPTDLAGIVADLRQQLTSDINGRRVRWVVHPLPRVQGDPAMLRVVFDNLLANAVKYTRPRDEAQIEIGSRDGDAGDTVLYVRDNGVGFDMQYRHKLFGVFQRLHSSDDFEGTGIGLATVRRIVARHGGQAWAEGRPGEGATFYISLPANGDAT